MEETATGHFFLARWQLKRWWILSEFTHCIVERAIYCRILLANEGDFGIKMLLRFLLLELLL